MSLHKGQLPAGYFHQSARHTQRLHDERLGRRSLPDFDREATLLWLRTVPAYRELIRQRVSEAARQAETLSRRIDADHADRDYLGQEVTGCG